MPGYLEPVLAIALASAVVAAGSIVDAVGPGMVALAISPFGASAAAFSIFICSALAGLASPIIF
jgi:hypothetical protein